MMFCLWVEVALIQIKAVLTMEIAVCRGRLDEKREWTHFFILKKMVFPRLKERGSSIV
jgi:hypothetical protein